MDFGPWTYDSQHRSGRGPLQADRSRQGPRESAEVHHPRRDDRPEGPRAGQHSRPAIDVPHFRHGQNGSGGVGQGEGEVGQPVGKGQGQEGDGKGQAGDQPGAHILEVDVSLEELADILGDELELPSIEPKGKESLKSRKDRYTSIRQTGPDSLRHFKRTFKQALKRQITLDDYNYENPVVIPMREDERFRSWKTSPSPKPTRP